ncbi:unnamed protein product [Parajaminaea phylloscopi]
MPRTHTFTFVTHGSLAVEVDVLLPEHATSAPMPLLIWYHGGGLVQGNRKAIAPHHLRAVDELGIVLVSPDYRLTPQIRVPELQDDLVALTSYVEDDLRKDLSAVGETVSLDLGRIAISGSSAGGWIALWMGLGMLPQIAPSFLSGVRAIAPIYPITTMDHPFFLDKQVPFLGRVDIPEESFAPFKDPNGPVTSNTADQPLRNKLYMHAQQEALFPSLLFSSAQRSEGWLQRTDVVRFIRSAGEREESRTWAPVYMVHGELDKAVAIDQARQVDHALRDTGHSVLLEERADKDHLWDLLEPAENFEGYWNFLKGHLQL